MIPDYPALRTAPEAAPLDMPEQHLRRGRLHARRPDRRAQAARSLLIAGTAAIAAVNAALAWDLLRPGGLSLPEAVTVVASTLLCAWVAFGFISAAAGLVIAWRSPASHRKDPAPVVSTRTAVLMPVYNEDPGRVLSAVQAMIEDLQGLGAAELYDFYLLSDTRHAPTARAEATGVLRLRLRLGDDARLFYRRRAHNTDRKAGNIADWVRRWGGAYQFMVVLDADSLMSGEAIVRMTAAMEADPGLGLFQTAPRIVGAETPFARLHQFAASLYGPIFALGQQWWSGDEGNYWGHNAIMRVRAFADSAGLPHLSGPAPMGGYIQSHDFVEAALMRRAGWKVRMCAALPGSYEETPPTLLDMAGRDRRWCQGNLQHIRLLSAPGLHWVGRLHLFRGAMSYLVSPLWLLLLACGSLAWPGLQSSPREAMGMAALFGLMTALLGLPRLMALALALRDRRQRAGFGGPSRLLAGMLTETAVSMLVAPVMMVMQATAVLQVLLGRDSGWAAQARDDGDVTPRLAWLAHRPHVALGVLGAVATALLDPNLFYWTSPVFAGLALSSLLSMHTARADVGRALGRLGLLRIPGEAAPDPVLARAAALRAAYAREAAARWEIDLLMKAPAPVYAMAPRRLPARNPVRPASADVLRGGRPAPSSAPVAPGSAPRQ